MRRTIWASLTALLLSLAALTSSPQAVAAGDAGAFECRPVDFGNLFMDGFGGYSWLGTNDLSFRTVTWSVIQPAVNGKTVTRPMSEAETDVIQQSFDSWDRALKKVDFQKLTNNQTPDITIGWTGDLTADEKSKGYQVSGNWSYTFLTNTKRLTAVYVQLRGIPQPELNRTQTVLIATIGQAMGLGALSASKDYRSVLEIPAPEFYSEITSFDRQLVRQLYGEELCNLADRDAIRLESLSAQVGSLQAQLTAATSSLSKLQSASKELEAKFTKKNGDYDTLSTEYADLVVDAEQSKAMASKLQTENKQLKAKLKAICAARPRPKGC